MTAPTPKEQRAAVRALLAERRARLYGQARFTASTRRTALAFIRDNRKGEHLMPDTPTRILDRLHDEALIENEERDWYRTGRIPCSDWGFMVRTKTLESLPEHGCTQHQQAKREREGGEAQ